MSEIVTVRMDAQDIVERVDEMLAYLATTFEGEEGSKVSFSTRNANRAEPYIRTDRHSWGLLTPTSVVIEDQEDWYRQPIEQRVAKSASIARAMGISTSVAYQVASGRTWGHVTKQAAA